MAGIGGALIMRDKRRTNKQSTPVLAELSQGHLPQQTERVVRAADLAMSLLIICLVFFIFSVNFLKFTCIVLVLYSLFIFLGLGCLTSMPRGVVCLLRQLVAAIIPWALTANIIIKRPSSRGAGATQTCPYPTFALYSHKKQF